MTIGMVVVAFLAVRAIPEFGASMMSTLRRTSSAASSGNRSNFPSAHLYSMAIFFPSTYPRSRRPCRNASRNPRFVDGEPDDRYPIVGTFVGCCASEEKQRARSIAHSVRTAIFLFMWFSRPLPPSLDDLIRSRKELG